MKIELLNYTPFTIADRAISKCWDKEFDTENVNYEKIERIANKFKHSSTIEHITYNYDIDGISRACLQELARHRIASLSVKSSRYTLKELKDLPYDDDRDDFIVLTGDTGVDNSSRVAIGNLQYQLKAGVSNDIAKYCLPESYKTSLVWTINARSLQNFLTLRTDKSALWEIRDLANAIYDALPNEHKFLFENCIKNNS